MELHFGNSKKKQEQSKNCYSKLDYKLMDMHKKFEKSYIAYEK